MNDALIDRLGEYHLPWYQLRGRGATLVTSSDPGFILAANAGPWGNKPAEPTSEGYDSLNCVPVCAPKLSTGKIRTVQIIGYGTNAPDEGGVWELYGYRSRYSPAVRIGKGTALLGTMDVVTDPVTGAAITDGFYVDTWGITETYWGLNEITSIDDAGDACSILTFDARGFTYLYHKLSIGTQTSIGAAFSGY